MNLPLLAKAQDRRVRAGLVCALFGLLAGCSAMAPALVDSAISAGRKFLLGAAETNFDSKYQENLEKLLDKLIDKYQPAEAEGGAPSSEAIADPFEPPPFTPDAGGADPAPAPDMPVSEPVASDPAPLPPPPVSGDPLALDVTIVKEIVSDGRSYAIPIEDGEVLRDGIGRAEEGDNFKITFRANRDCYVYVVSVDATAWAQPLFPSGFSSYSNPVKAGQTYELPDGQDWLYLDNYRGIETFYFLASPYQRADLEQVLGDLAGQTRELNDEARVAIVDQDVSITRGIGGKRPGKASLVTSSTGQKIEDVPSTTFLGSASGEDILFTRWFRHE